MTGGLINDEEGMCRAGLHTEADGRESKREKTQSVWGFIDL